jgi:hypothetical protein
LWDGRVGGAGERGVFPPRGRALTPNADRLSAQVIEIDQVFTRSLRS